MRRYWFRRDECPIGRHEPPARRDHPRESGGWSPPDYKYWAGASDRDVLLLPVGRAGATRAHRQRRSAAHLFELYACGHLLRDQCRLNAVEQAFQPADELRLRDAELGLARYVTGLERQRQALQLLDQLRLRARLELDDGAAVDLGQPLAPRLVQRR